MVKPNAKQSVPVVNANRMLRSSILHAQWLAKSVGRDDIADQMLDAYESLADEQHAKAVDFVQRMKSCYAAR